MSQEKSSKKLSRSARYNKKRRLNKEQKSTLPADNINPTLITTNIIFNLNRHRMQFATRGLCTSDKIHYIEKEWKSVPLSFSDCVASKGVKVQERVSTRELLIETLIREATFTRDNEIPYIPPKFLKLLDREIIKIDRDDEEETQINALNSGLWVAFGRWLGVEEPVTRRCVRRHLRSKWMKLKHVMREETEYRNNKPRSDPSITTTHISWKEKTQLIISARGNTNSLKGLVRFRYIERPKCVTDVEGRTLIHLGVLNNSNAILKATEAVNHYYFHTLNNPSHRSDEFWTNFIEHFGVYARNNLLPYTSSNTASAHNVEHQECVDTLLHDLEPLSTSINGFVQEYYGELYGKLEKLSWGVFGPKSFGVFPMIAINFNTISDYHWDEHDESNSLCCLVALGDFEGGELCFPQLQIIVPLRPGQVVAFSSRLLLHGNFPVTKGIRHSVVYFVHSMFFHHLRDFSDIYKDREDGIERDSHGSVVPRQDLNDARNLNKTIRLTKPKKSQTEMPEKSCDKRRGNIDLTRARRGLRAEDLIPDES